MDVAGALGVQEALEVVAVGGAHAAHQLPGVVQDADGLDGALGDAKALVRLPGAELPGQVVQTLDGLINNILQQF